MQPEGLGQLKFNDISDHIEDRLCGLVVRVSGCRFRGPGFDSQHYQIFLEVVGLELGLLSLVSTIEELLGRKVTAPVWITKKGSVVLTTLHPLSAKKVGTNFDEKRRSLADLGHGVCFDHIGNPTRHFPVCNIVPQLTTLPRAL
jgi:hypothetical protein